MPKFWFPTTKNSFPAPNILITILFLLSLLPSGARRAGAQTVLSCDLVDQNQSINNRAIADYNQTDELDNRKNVISNTLTTRISGDSGQQVQVTSQGIEDEAGNVVSALGTISNGLIATFQEQGLNGAAANAASLAAISQWAALPADSSSEEVVIAVKQFSTQKLGEEEGRAIEQIPDAELLATLAGLEESSLEASGLSPQEIEATSNAEITPQTEGTLTEQIQAATQTTVASIERPEAKEQIAELQAQSESELNSIRQGDQETIAQGSLLRFKFRLDNQSDEAAVISLPNVQNITEQGLTGAGRVTGVVYNLTNADPASSKTITDTAQDVSIPPRQSLDLAVQVEVLEVPQDQISTISLNLNTSCSPSQQVQAQSLNILPVITPEPGGGLIDPRGKISGCAGELLPDYQGFSVGLYDVDANDPTASEASNITPLTATEVPDDPNNDVPLGIEPNIENSNPFFLTNSDEGQYSFLFDEEAGQLDKGRNYILVVEPGAESTYDQRRIKITIGDRQERIVEYTATSLDGRPISADDGQTTITGEILLVSDAERVGLNLAVLDLSANICDAEEISITKTGDRSAAEPGDIVLYRLALRNLASVPLTNFQVADTLPRGFRFEADSVRGEFAAQPIAVETTQNGQVVNFTATELDIPPGEVLNVIYAAQVTADALRGSGENSAIVNAQRTDNNLEVKDGPAIHTLELEPGIIQDSGTIIGRVFVDKNFDGEQQPGEPGIPNAVIYLEDGNRIITDADGLFSVTNILPGQHTGILDFTSIPEYRLAPNLRFSEANSKSRLVNLGPGGMVRMNFGVTPTAAGKNTDSRRKVPSSPPRENPAESPTENIPNSETP